MNSIELTMSRELLTIPAQMHRSSEEYLTLLTETYMGPVCQSCNGRCCNLCAESKGYLENTHTRGQINYLKKKYGWDKKRGFLTDTGCRLPRSERSWVCKSYICQAARSVIPNMVADYITRSALWLQNPHMKEIRIEEYGRQYD